MSESIDGVFAEAEAAVDELLRILGEVEASENAPALFPRNRAKRVFKLGPRRPAQLEHAVREQLMTFDELSEQVGHKPHPDKLGGRWQMSKRYKDVETATGDAKGAVEATGDTSLSAIVTDEAERAKLEGLLGAQLDKLIEACEAYQRQHAGKQPKVRAAQLMIKNARAYKESLKRSLGLVLADPAVQRVAGKLTIDQAIFAKECGISFFDCQLDLYNDDELVSADEGFGSGAVNTVAKLVHQDGTGRVFKPEQSTDEKSPTVTKTLGIDPNAPHYGNRNIASRGASDLLGLDVMPEVAFAVHDGSVGLLMGMAPGKSPRRKVWQDLTPKECDDCDMWEREGGNWLQNFKNQNIEKRGGKWQRGREMLVKPWAPPSPSPDLQASLHEELNGLEWCDMLTGQGDRHSANYMLDIQGDTAKVTGIDNDFAFGKTQTGLLTYDPDKGITSVGTPKLIDRKTYVKLAAADFDGDMLPKLKGLLTDEEIDASRQRFAAVKAEAARLSTVGCVVDDWKTWRSSDGNNHTASEFLAAAGTPSLFKRDFAKFFREDGVLA
ncbi:MAG: hypothetical protein JO157_14065 [Acetobacteraceae bacterium]|nr:hypothetical protein [Acetobacteraceae bacterium]